MRKELAGGRKGQGLTEYIIVVALVAVFATRGFQKKTDIAGTIGAANRYQSQQVAANDVGLKDPEVQRIHQAPGVVDLLREPLRGKGLRIHVR